MKIICINSKNRGFNSNLTTNKWYEVIKSRYECYFIKNDLGEQEWYDFDRFLTFEEFRDKRIKEILE
jgi:hypothetical protein